MDAKKLMHKRLSKYSATQLLKKLDGGNFSSHDERLVTLDILKQRGQLPDDNQSITETPVPTKKGKKEVELPEIEESEKIEEVKEEKKPVKKGKTVGKFVKPTKEDEKILAEAVAEEEDSVSDLGEDDSEEVTVKSKKKSEPKVKKEKINTDGPVDSKITVGMKVEFQASAKSPEFAGKKVTGFVKRVWLAPRDGKVYCRVMVDGKIIEKRDNALTEIKK